jgi:hypothetical protein
VSVDDPCSVDAIGRDPDSGRVVLTIIDQLPWYGAEHYSALDAKVRGYIGFIESGQLVEAYADAGGRDVEIRLVCQHKPDQDAVSFLDALRSATERRGIRFTHRRAIHDQ